MSNSQDYLLQQIFLLTLENNRLNKIIDRKSADSMRTQSTAYYDQHDNYTLNRIAEIEERMNEECNMKDKKISELNDRIRQLHANNTDTMQKYQNLIKNYDNLEQTYVRQVSQLKALNQYQQNSNKKSQQTQSQNQYHTKLVEKQKEFLQQQLEKLRKVTIKELQSDIELLNRQNSSYILSINTYRQEITVLKRDKNDLTNKVIQLQQSQNGIKKQNQKLKSQNQKLTNKVNNELKQMQKENERIRQQLNEKMKEDRRKLTKQFEIQLRKRQESLERRKQKLREYDHQYDSYVNKMNLMAQDLNKLKAQNSKLKESKQKITEQKTNEMNKKQTNHKKISTELQGKVRNLEEKLQESERNCQKLKENNNKYVKEIGMLEKQLQGIKKSSSNTVNNQIQKVREAEKARDQAINQWEGLLKEMEKKNIIIKSLEQQIQQYRKISNLRTNLHQKNQPKYHYQNNQQKQQPSQQRKDDISDLMGVSIQQDEQQEISSIKQIFRCKRQDRKSESIIKKVQMDIQQIHASYYSQSMQKNQNKKQPNENEKKLTKYRSASNLYQQDPYCCQDCSNNNNNRGQLKNQRNKTECSYGNQNKYKQISMKRKDYGDIKRTKYDYINDSIQKKCDEKILIIDQENEQQKHFFKQEKPTNQTTIYDYSYQSGFMPKQPLRQSMYSKNSNSLPKYPSQDQWNSDSKYSEMQKYLSFELKPASHLKRSNSDKKVYSDQNQASSNPQRIQSERMKTLGEQTNLLHQNSSKQLLMEKINKMNTWRDNNKSTTNIYNKRNPHLTLQRDKQNLNDIIHKKCLFMLNK